jgi:competence protein ComEC
MKRPLLPIVISYCTGLIVSHYFPVPRSYALILFLISFAVLVAAFLLKRRFWATLFSFLLFFLLGILFLTPYTNPKFPPSHIIHFADNQRVNVEGVIDTSPVVTRFHKRLFVRATHIHTRDSSFSVSGRLQLSIKESEKRFHLGDRIRFFCFLRRPRNFENPGRFDYVRYLAYRKIFITAFLPDDRGIVKTGKAEANWFLLWVEKYRARVGRLIDQTLSSPASDILKALILGKKGTIPDYIKEQFARLGIAHLLAISGLHIGIITFVAYIFFMTLLRTFHRVLLYIDSFQLSVIFAVFPVIFYCFIAGFHLPTLRAFLMIAAYVAALLLGRRQDLLNTLFMAAFIILIFMPTSLFDISFQLSFAAVLSLTVILPVVQPLLYAREDDIPFDQRNRVLDRLYRVIIGSFLASAAAILGTAPLVALNFHRFSFMGFFANIILIPFVGFFIVPLGLMATMVLPLSAAFSQTLLACTGMLIDELLVITQAWSSIGIAEMKIAVPNIWEVALFYMALFSFPLFVKRGKMKYFIIGIACLLVMELAVIFYQSRGTGLLRVTFLDVGKGDAALVEFPDRKVMLIDGGGFRDESFDVGRAVLAPILYKKGIKKVDYVVLSHPHKDHMGGLPYIVENFRVRELWLNREVSGSRTYKKLMMLERLKGVKKVFLSAGSDTILIAGVQLKVISPEQSEDVAFFQSYWQTNNNSLVMKITFGKTSFLFTGDIHKQRENMLVEKGAPLFSTVLKVPHHGRDTSSSYDFVRRVLPEVAVISCRSLGGKKVSSQRVLDEYRRIGTQVYITDRDGAVMIETDGKIFNVLLYKTKKNDIFLEKEDY